MSRMEVEVATLQQIILTVESSKQYGQQLLRLNIRDHLVTNESLVPLLLSCTVLFDTVCLIVFPPLSFLCFFSLFFFFVFLLFFSSFFFFLFLLKNWFGCFC
eukprot:m.130542 g.130542  ORF g.130542 m.130542 type:complete len:102 (+) comp13902_c0_seq1:1265-1570(+)